MGVSLGTGGRDITAALAAVAFGCAAPGFLRVGDGEVRGANPGYLVVSLTFEAVDYVFAGAQVRLHRVGEPAGSSVGLSGERDTASGRDSDDGGDIRVDADSRIAGEQRPSRLVVVALAPGQYELGWCQTAGTMRRRLIDWRSPPKTVNPDDRTPLPHWVPEGGWRQTLPISFAIEPGRITYLGNLLQEVTHASADSPYLVDESSRDLGLLTARYPELARLEVVKAPARWATPAFSAVLAALRAAGNRRDGGAARVEILLRLAEAGDPLGQVMLGHAWLAGRGVTEDPATALRWYQEAASRGFVGGQVSAAAALRAGASMQGSAGARQLLEQAAAQGDPFAEYYLGCMWESGELGSADREAAQRWYLRAAGRGHGPGRNSLARLLSESGALREAAWWLTGQRVGSDAAAANAIGTAWEYMGLVDVPDVREAIPWYTRAALAGHRPAQHRLVNVHARGIGVAVDCETAHRWWLLGQQAGQDWAGDERTPWFGLGMSSRWNGEGLAVLQVYPGLSAERAGLRAGDVITAVDGQSIAGYEAATQVQSGLFFRTGQVLELDVVRPHEERPLKMQAAESRYAIRCASTGRLEVRVVGPTERLDRRPGPETRPDPLAPRPPERRK